MQVAPPLGLEPRHTVPKTAVLPLHQGGMLQIYSSGQKPDCHNRTMETPSATTHRRTRMTRSARREQLIDTARALFATQGYDAVSIEEIAAHAGVSKPVVYEHFGSKEGIYQVIVDREVTFLTNLFVEYLKPGTHPRIMLEQVLLAVLDYIETHPEGFRLLAHQSPSAVGGENFTTVMGDVAEQLGELLVPVMREQGFEPTSATIYGQLLAGAAGRIGQWWVDSPEQSKEVVAGHAVNLLWNGLRGIDRGPGLITSATGEMAAKGATPRSEA